MKLVGMILVRNEDWILGLSLRTALLWCDAVVVLLHSCTDNSRDIVMQARAENPGIEFLVIETDEPDWPEMGHRQLMLEGARTLRATHMAIIDADEILTSNIIGTFTREGREAHINPSMIRCAAASLERGMIMQLPGYNLRNGVSSYHSNGVWGKRWFSVGFKDDPALGWAGDTFHRREPQGRTLRPFQPFPQGSGGVMHLWGASERRLIAKHCWYKITEAIMAQRPIDVIDREYSMSIHGRGSGDNPSTWTYADVPESWWSGYAHLMQFLHLDTVPWQEAECRRLVEQHGRGITKGLDLFGVV